MRGVDTRLGEMEEALECFSRLTGELRTTSARMLECVDEAGPGDTESATCLKVAIEELGLLGRVQHGVLMQVLARAHQKRAVPGGVSAFLAGTQGVSQGRARTLVEDAKRISTEPVIGRRLTEGGLGPEGTRVIARTLKAVAGLELETQRQAVTDAITIIETDGVTKAAKQIPRIEERSERGSPEEIAARQRRRSFARVVKLDHGACRFEILLDAERALKVRSAVDAFGSCVVQRRSIGLDMVPDDVRTADQIRAEAFAHIAEAFINSGGAEREAEFSLPSLLYGTLGLANPGAKRIYVEKLHGSVASKSYGPSTDVALFDRDARSVGLNGRLIDKEGLWSRLKHRRQKKFTLRSRLAGP